MRLPFVSEITNDTGDHVLMFVVGKLDHELKWDTRITKGKPNIASRRDGRVADGTNYRPRSLEKLRAMAAHAGVMTGIIGYVGKVPYLFPVFCGRLVASVAAGLVFLCGVRKSRIIDRAGSSSSLRCWSSRPTPLPLCAAYDECGGYSVFTRAGKTVLQVEYEGSIASVCRRSPAALNTMLKRYELDGWRRVCP